jgi:hypothetical protein
MYNIHQILYFCCWRCRIKTFVRANNNIIFIYVLHNIIVCGALSAARELCICRTEDLFCIIHVEAPGEKGCTSIVVFTGAVRARFRMGKGNQSHNSAVIHARTIHALTPKVYTHSNDDENTTITTTKIIIIPTFIVCLCGLLGTHVICGHSRCPRSVGIPIILSLTSALMIFITL